MAGLALSKVSFPEPARAAAPGALARLKLSRFRSYVALALEVDTRPVVLVGENGAGKTNLLEAISYLGPGRGLRGATASAVAHRVAEGSVDSASPAWAVAARVTAAVGMADLGTGQTPEGGERRQARIDGASESLSALSAHIRLLWLTPAQDRLFLDAASGRRKFLDRLTLSLDPGHAARSTAYERAMRERNRLLRDGPRDPAWLSGLEAEMASHGVALAVARVAALRALAERLEEGMGPAGTAFPRGRVALEGQLEAALSAGRAHGDVETEFARTLGRSRGRDEAAGRALDGPQTSDLLVTHAASGRPAAECSTGEQKALLVGLILAQARLVGEEGLTPVLLLDEIAAHLDARRREALFDVLVALGAQAWLTGTDAQVFAPLGARAQHFTVAEGSVQPA